MPDLSLELLKRIPRGRKVTVNDIYDGLRGTELEREKRTIQRQLQKLAERHPIEVDCSSKPYGYRWKDQAPALTLPGMSLREALLLSLAKEHLRQLLPPALLKSLAGFFKQADTMLMPHANAKLERQWLKKVRVVNTTQPLLPPAIDPEVMETVANALYANHSLRLDFFNRDRKEHKDQLVLPLGLAQQGPRFYLLCQFDGFTDFRKIALNRIRRALDTGSVFECPPGFDLAKYDADGGLGHAHGRRVKVCFRIKKPEGEHLLESRLSEDQQHKELRDAYEIQATVPDTVLLRRWLKGFGDVVSQVKMLPA